jgi:hypothetical protein
MTVSATPTVGRAGGVGGVHQKYANKSDFKKIVTFTKKMVQAIR